MRPRRWTLGHDADGNLNGKTSCLRGVILITHLHIYIAKSRGAPKLVYIYFLYLGIGALIVLLRDDTTRELYADSRLPADDWAENYRSSIAHARALTLLSSHEIRNDSAPL